jgi:2-dehydro-3-deoxyphosphogluconate aldolase/(4S)-4-hydroxy-2-oxoglutarate aldolase
MDSMTKAEVRTRIEEIGIIPALRVPTPEQAIFGAEAVNHAGIPIVEITNTVPDAAGVISRLTQRFPDMVVGGGTVLDTETARRCLDAGATFLTSPGLVMEVVEFALRNDVVVFPGALTPSEVITAWKAGVDFVKIFPCAPVGGHIYIRSLKVPMPQIPLIATGGVNQTSAVNFILAGATALGIGAELIPHEALQRRKEEQIHELARRYLSMVKHARERKAGR